MCNDRKVQLIRPDNLCQNLPRAITLFKLNEIESQRYMITFHHRRRVQARISCENIVSELTKHLHQGITASIDVNNCKSDFKQIAGELNLKALELVSDIHNGEYIRT